MSILVEKRKLAINYFKVMFITELSKRFDISVKFTFQAACTYEGKIGSARKEVGVV